jgi:tRNA nucleotidyltransferase (CCA-adding enzyme)
MSSSNARWEHFPHDADIGIRGIGVTKEDAFAQAALAVTAVVTDPATVAAEEMVAITCEAPDDELLLVDWLNAVVYEMATRRMLFGRFVVQLNGSSLSAEAWGESVDVAKHQPAVEVKGATYTELKITQAANGTWTAQCVVDV